MTEHRPDISIAVIAYNHERFISDTFRGIAMQQFSGTVEVVIGDDCSPDCTRELARAFAEQHPKLLQLHLCMSVLSSGLSVGNANKRIFPNAGRYRLNKQSVSDFYGQVQIELITTGIFNIAHHLQG